MSFQPSQQQQAIFDWVSRIRKGDRKSLVIRARAGTGKTTTIIAALQYLVSGLNVLLGAFGKDIQMELNRRITGMEGVEARTWHSLGLSFVKRQWPTVAPDYGPDRADDLARRACPPNTPDHILRLVAKLCTQGRLMVPLGTTVRLLVPIAYDFDCAPDEQWEEQGFTVDWVAERAMQAMDLAAQGATDNGEPGGIIDGADMLFLPVRNGWLIKRYDVVIVDEAQDMNASQLCVAQGVCRGTFIVVGDDRQAIYGFAGADSNSLDRLKKKLGSDELPLNQTYRCAKSIVAIAQQWVPDYTAAETNPEGDITEVGAEQLITTAAHGDYILSRTNAPLVQYAMQLLKMGKRARIAGRDTGKGLVSLITKMKAKSVPDLLVKIERWLVKQESRLTQQLAEASNGRARAIQSKIAGVRDQAEMLTSLAAGASSVDGVIAEIGKLFTDDGLGEAGVITLSSVHKAKGKEAPRCFILKNTLRSGGEEDNIAYVAVTRAKSTLVWVL